MLLIWWIPDGDKLAEIELLENFDRVINCFLELKPKYQEIITDICREMGLGMAKYLDYPIVTLSDFNDYCHYVAGLVPIGLCRFSIVSGLAHYPDFPELLPSSIPPPELLRISNAVGLFVQKVNSIRDILDDLTQVPPRIFWPKAVWSKYVDDIHDLIHNNSRFPFNVLDRTAVRNLKRKAVACLNELITDGMTHVVDCMEGLRCYKSAEDPPDTTI